MFDLVEKKMRMKVFMEGSVNHHAFKCVAEGEGNPYKGFHSIKIKVTEGGPLPFAYEILALGFSYGQKVFIDYPDDIPDFYKQSFPEGYTWERVTTYEDGGVLALSSDTSLQGNCVVSHVKVLGTNFPPNGPVMKKKTKGWEPSTEIVYPHNGDLRTHDAMALKLDGGGHLLCFLKTTFRSKKKKITLPKCHFHDYRLDIDEADKSINIQQAEGVVARCSPLPSLLGKPQTGSKV